MNLPIKWLLLLTLLPLTLLMANSSNVGLNSHLQQYGYQVFNITKLPTGHDSIRVTINDTEGVFIIDSGAQVTVLHQARLRKYHIDNTELTDVEQSFAAGGVGQLSQYRLDSLEISGQTFNIERLAVLDLGVIFGALSSSSGILLDGIIGQDVLTKYQGLIDVAQQQLLLMPGFESSDNKTLSTLVSEFLLEQNYLEIPLQKLASGHETVPASINGVRGLFVLDSGAGRSIIHNQQAEKFGLTESSQIGTGSSAGAGGAFGYQRYAIESLVLDQQLLAKSYIDIADLGTVTKQFQDSLGIDIDGVIGQDVLIENNSIIDVAGSRLFIKPSR